MGILLEKVRPPRVLQGRSRLKVIGTETDPSVGYLLAGYINSNSAARHETTGTGIRPVQAVTEE